MATRAMNFMMEESDILGMKKDPFYRLTVDVEEASADEMEEILAEIEGMSEDDLSISSVKHFPL